MESSVRYEEHPIVSQTFPQIALRQLKYKIAARQLRYREIAARQPRYRYSS